MHILETNGTFFSNKTSLSAGSVVHKCVSTQLFCRLELEEKLDWKATRDGKGGRGGWCLKNAAGVAMATRKTTRDSPLRTAFVHLYAGRYFIICNFSLIILPGESVPLSPRGGGGRGGVGGCKQR